jgi:multimeric flavodoxin WrbA
MARRVLGLSCGSVGGSPELLLRRALQAAVDDGAEVELVRLVDLRLPSTGTGVGGSLDPVGGDDAGWFWERLIACDGWIVSSPIISRTVPGRLKLLADRLLGPNADAAIIEGLLEVRRSGQEPTVPFRVDERVLKSRVAGFIACGGALTTQWKTLALPVLHTLAFSMHIKVVDQMLVEGAGTPQSVLLDEEALARASMLGHHVAGQLDRGWHDAQYLGAPGLCPMCHLDVVVLDGRDVGCATCGARGRLTDEFEVHWTDLSPSVIGMDEKRAHYVEIVETAQRHAMVRDRIDALAAQYADESWVVRPADSVAASPDS